MKVGIDARSVTGPRGVTRYTTELLRALVRAFPDDRFVLFVPGHGELPAIADLLAASNVSVYRHRTAEPRPVRLCRRAAPTAARAPGRRAARRGLGARARAGRARRRGARRPHAPRRHLGGASRATSRPTNGSGTASRGLARSRRGCGSLIVPTPAVRDELIARWDVAPARVHVVPEGVRTESAGAVDVDARLAAMGLAAGRFLLVSGAIEPRKAPEVIAQAYAAARARGSATPSSCSRATDDSPTALAGPGVRVLGWRDVIDLEALYQGALALVLRIPARGLCAARLRVARAGDAGDRHRSPGIRPGTVSRAWCGSRSTTRRRWPTRCSGSPPMRTSGSGSGRADAPPSAD